MRKKEQEHAMLYVMHADIGCTKHAVWCHAICGIKTGMNLQQSQVPCMAKVLVASERPCPVLPVGWQLLISWMISALLALHLGTNNISMAHLMLTHVITFMCNLIVSWCKCLRYHVLHFLSVAFVLRPSWQDSIEVLAYYAGEGG